MADFHSFDSRTFQSTLPARGATPELSLAPPARTISIHAPRTGSDVCRLGLPAAAEIFQSTLPARGATGALLCAVRNTIKFQSTLPARGATLGGRRGGGDVSHFNPRSPHGERL